MLHLNNLGTIILTPLVVFLLLAGFGLFHLISNSVDDFASRSIRENLGSLARAAYEEADREIDRCDIKRLDCMRGAQKTIHQLVVFERFEDFAREHQIGLIVEVDRKAVFVTGVEQADSEALLRLTPVSESERVQLSDGQEVYVKPVAFTPWRWRIVLVKDITAFEVLAAQVRNIYVGSALGLLMITLLLAAWLRQTLVRPIYSIVKDFGESRVPGYKGIKELEFLASRIGGMMSSLQAKTLHLETTLQSMSDGIAVFDADMRLVAWNGNYVRLYRYPPELIRPGVAFEEIMRYNIDRGDYGPGDPERHLARIVERARNLDPPRFEIDRADGTSVEVRRAPMPDGGFVTTYTDVTDRKQAARLELANEAKSQFLENMSHDLRKPITAIIEDARLVKDASGSDEDADHHRNLENIQVSSKHLLGMVDGLLALSRIETGQVEVNAEEVAVESIVGQGIRVVEPVAKMKGLSLQTEVADGLCAVTDQHLLLRILVNLGGNAAEYTDEGHISVCARRRGDDLEISVSDTGTGIPTEKLGIIFEKFQQVEPAAGMVKPGRGLGLGLAICRELARLLGGRVTVESVPGEGSVFTVSVPIEYRGAVS